MTSAVPETDNVDGLAYVAAVAPGEGETIADIASRPKDSALPAAVLEKQFPVGEGPQSAAELVTGPARFRDVLIAGLPRWSPTFTAFPSGYGGHRHS